MRKKKTEGWYSSSRNYLHFDEKISFARASNIVKDPSTVARWSFYPFLQALVKSSKASRKECGQLERKQKERPISYAAHADSHIYSYYALNLQNQYEEKVVSSGIGDNVIGFRKLGGRCNIDFAKRAFDDIRASSPCVALSFDVKNFFDEIDHGILKQTWCMVLDTPTLPADHYAVFKSLTKFAYVMKDEAFKLFGVSRSRKQRGLRRICSADDFRNTLRPQGIILRNHNPYGIPQGSPISGLLSNIYLFDFDRSVSSQARAAGAFYYRYCDDIIVICKQEHEDLFLSLINVELGRLNLRTNDKTSIRRFTDGPSGVQCDKPIQYLGFVFDGQRTVIRSSSHSRFLKRMRKAVSLAKRTRAKHNEKRRQRNIPETALNKKNLYIKYSYLGKRNYISYAHKAAKIMNEVAIKRQVKPLWKRLCAEIEAG